MSPEKQRIAIAEECGWKSDYSCGYLLWLGPSGYWGTHEADLAARNGEMHYPPDYLNDLNAMHEAEKADGIGSSVLYYGNLVAIAGPHPITATARQRAEAFLRTIGKWEDTE